MEGVSPSDRKAALLPVCGAAFIVHIKCMRIPRRSDRDTLLRAGTLKGLSANVSPFPEGPGTQIINSVLGPEYRSYYSIWAPECYYLGPIYPHISLYIPPFKGPLLFGSLALRHCQTMCNTAVTADLAAVDHVSHSL